MLGSRMRRQHKCSRQSNKQSSDLSLHRVSPCVVPQHLRATFSAPGVALAEHIRDIISCVSIVASWHSKRAPHDVISSACCFGRVSPSPPRVLPLIDVLAIGVTGLARVLRPQLTCASRDFPQASFAAATAPRCSHRRDVDCLGCSCACRGC